ncbi:Lovastatin diketide synthase LovF [Colletotrichum tanaceti]|nr:Lovastatin diketide synthase LovF [Colletotrichum tanaceti]
MLSGVATPSSDMDASDPIVIVGMAVRLPGGVRNTQDFWRLMMDKRSGLIPIPQERWNSEGFYSPAAKWGTVQNREAYMFSRADNDLAAFDASHFTCGEREIERMDPMQRQLLEIARECLDNAGETGWRGREIGCYVGNFSSDWQDDLSMDPHASGLYRGSGYLDFLQPNRVSYEYGWTGPSMLVKTGCSSSMVALHLAAEAVQSGACKSAMAMGCNLITSVITSIVFTETGVLSPSGKCKTFDLLADGYGRGEAVNAVYVKRLSDALRDGNPVRAVIRASATNNDGRSNGIMSPNTYLQEALIRKTYDRAGVPFNKTAFFECHGTGTPTGDPLEVAAVARIWKDNEGVMIGAVKPNVGHSEGAAGLTSVIKAVLALENRVIPPNIYMDNPNPRIPWEEAKLSVPMEPTPWPEDRDERISVNSFGVAGSNAHVILESFEGWQKLQDDASSVSSDSGVSVRPPPGRRLLLFSASHMTSLEKQVDQHREYLARKTADVDDLAYTLGHHRDHLSCRAYAITNEDGGGGVFEVPSSFKRRPAVPRRLVLAFTGQGVHWGGMGKRLIESNGVFRAAIARLDVWLQSLPESHRPHWTLEEELSLDDASSRVGRRGYSHPCATAVQIALVDVLASLGIRPDAVTGHSGGEAAAAYAAGSISAEAAMAVAYFRGWLLVNGTVPPGTMAAVSLGPREVEPFLIPGVVVGCENSQLSTTLSGDPVCIQHCVDQIMRRHPDVKARVLDLETSFHSPWIEPLAGPYEELLKPHLAGARAPAVPHFSSVTGLEMTGDEFGAGYWRRNFVQPVLFNTAVRALVKSNPSNLFVEVGPHPALQRPVNEIVRSIPEAAAACEYITTLHRGEDTNLSMLRLAGELFLQGAPVDMASVIPKGRVLTDTPTYPWYHDVTYMDEPRNSRRYKQRKHTRHVLLGARVLEGNDIEPAWRNMLDLKEVPWLMDHMVNGQIVFPGAGYVAMAGEAMRQVANGQDAYTIRDMSITTGMTVPREKKMELYTRMIPEDRPLPRPSQSPAPGSPDEEEEGQWYHFKIMSYDGHHWVSHCSGFVRSGAEADKTSVTSAQAEQEFAREIEAEGWYKAVKAVGIDWQTAFQGLDRISANPSKPLPDEMKAVIIQGRGQAAITTSALPKLRDGYLLVKVAAVAVNPSDWKHVDFMWVGDPTGTRPGLEYAGVVVDVGPGVDKDFKAGDRVFGIINGSNVRQKEDGAFAEYAVAKAALQMKIPDHVDDTEAAAITSGLVAVGQGLYQSLELPLPTNPSPEPIPLLIYGGSTASGVMGIQFAKLSNCTVAVTCSPKNFAYVKSLGADFCVDYRAADCVEQIRAFTKGRLRHAWDCVATAQSARACASAMSTRGGRYSSLLYLVPSIVKKINPKIVCSATLGYTILGETIEKETVIEPRPDDYEFGKMFWAVSETLLRQDKFRPVRQIVNEGGGGLEGVLHGIQYLKQGNVSAGNCRPSHSNLTASCIAAFGETKRNTDSIVTDAGFAGYYDNVHPRQKTLIVQLILKAFQKLRCDVCRTKPGQRLRPIKCVPGVQRQLDFCYEMLAEAGLTPLPPRAVDPGETLAHIVRDYPAYAALNKLVAHAGTNLAEIYAGRTDGVRSIFGSAEGREYLEEIYGPAHPSKAFHGLMEDFMGRFLEAVAAVPDGHDGPSTTKQKKLNLLELGAGTGGTTKWLAPLLAGAARSGRVPAVEYTFTDLAHGFVSQAARRFAEYPFMTYRTQDIERPPPADLAGTQDVVVAVNAVHATPDMVESLRNLRRFLRPGGFALVMEVQERLCWADFVFGLFEGWWVFGDGRTHATADAGVWKAAFEAAGFRHVDWTGGELRDSGLQRVFLATYKALDENDYDLDHDDDDDLDSIRSVELGLKDEQDNSPTFPDEWNLDRVAWEQRLRRVRRIAWIEAGLLALLVGYVVVLHFQQRFSPPAGDGTPLGVDPSGFVPPDVGQPVKWTKYDDETDPHYFKPDAFDNLDKVRAAARDFKMLHNASNVHINGRYTTYMDFDNERQPLPAYHQGIPPDALHTICGIGLRLPGGIDTPTSLYNFLVNRKDARSQPDQPRYGSQTHHFTESGGGGGTTRPLPTEQGYWLRHDDVAKFDPSMFSMSPKELAKLDPQQRLLLQVVWEALESAGETGWQGRKIGCYVGTFGDDWREMHAVDTQDDGMYRLTGYMDFVQANRISHVFDLRGPSMTVRTACSAAGLAVHLACQAIRAGECDAAVVAGANLMLSPGFTRLMAEQGVLSPEASCKTFDAGADGYARAEAVNCLFVKRLRCAVRDGNPIRAVIRGSATNSDGKTLGLTTPSAQAQRQLIRDAYRQAGIPEGDMWRTAMVECHGTGTAVGDTVEACTVGTVFGEKGMLIGSVKPNLGHSEAASAITSIVKAVLSLETRTIIPNIKFENPSISIPFDTSGLRVPTEALSWPEDREERIGVNSFGIGGTNVHIIIESAASVACYPTAVRGPGNVDTPPPSPPLRREPATLLLFSASSEESLKRAVRGYQDVIQDNPLKLEALAYTLTHRRSHLAYRTFAVVAGEWTGSTAPEFLPAPTFRPKSESKDVAFVFTGQGAQWARMGSHLMKTSKEFLQDIREMDAALKCLPRDHQPAWEISRELMRADAGSRLGEAEFAQPVCTALQVALVRHLARYGVGPNAVVGHSSGEIAAAYAAGTLTAKEAIIVAYYRGYMAKKLGKRGAMAAIGLGRDQVTPFLTSGGGGGRGVVVVACENSSSSVTLSGDWDALEAVCHDIRAAKPDALVRILKALLRPHLSPKSPRIPFYSSVSPQTSLRGSDLGPEYWQRNLESPVLFRQAVTSLLQKTASTSLLLEVGPHSALAGPLKQICSENALAPPYVAAQRRGLNSAASFLAAVGELHCRGVAVDFPVIMDGGAGVGVGVRPLTDLPPYPWNLSKTYWPDSRIIDRWRFPEHPPHELLGRRVSETEGGAEPGWRCRLSLDNVPWIMDHRVGSDIVFPAAGYVAMAGEAVRQLTEQYAGFTIREMRIMNALVISPVKAVELLTSARRQRLTYNEVSEWWELTIQSCSSNNTDTWTTHCTCRIKGGNDLKIRTLPGLQKDSLLRVTEPSRWYKQMSRVGYNYGPLFRRMQAVRSSVTSPAVEVEISDCRVGESAAQSYAMHPTAIDHVFQSLVVATSSGEPRQLDKVYLPTCIDQVSINAETETETRGCLIRTLKTGRDGCCQGDSVALSPADPTDQPLVYMKGLRFSPIDLVDSTQHGPDTSRVAHMVWKPDVDLAESTELIQPASPEDFPEIHRLLEDLFIFCGLATLQDVDEASVLSEQTQPHLRKHYRWLGKQVARSSRAFTALTTVEVRDKIKNIRLQLENTPASAVATLISRCYTHAQSLFTSDIGPLELFLQDNALHELYDWMNTLFTYTPLLQLLSHKRGRHLRILEIGAGTGGLTARILKSLTECFDDDDDGKVLGKYVFTDVSSGFFPAAKARFDTIPEGFLEYRVLDISHDPADQGFGGEQYDLIVASNVLHATPDLTKTLQHVRTLLKPEGRLLMHELCCDTKWINFIMGYLSGWWLGESDRRDDEPYISPDRWEERLALAGFSKPDVFYDAGQQQHRLNATIVARPAHSTSTMPSAPREITILCEEESHPVVVDLRNHLQNQGLSVTCTTLSAGDIRPCAPVVSAVDLCRGDGYFHDMTQGKLDDVKRLLRKLQSGSNLGLLWVTRPCQVDPQDPTFAAVLGVARTCRVEMGVPFCTLEVDGNGPGALSAVSRVLHKTLLRHGVSKSAQRDEDSEFSYSAGRILVPRCRWLPISRVLQDDGHDTTSPSPSKMLHVSRPGALQSLCWIPRLLSDRIPSDQVQVKVHAAGLNFKDVVTAMGLIDPSSQSPNGLGCEASGVVTATGSRVAGLRVGDRVMVFAPQAACFSTDIRAPAQLCVRIPDHLGFADAATMPCVFVTVLRALLDKAGLRAGQTVLVHSAAGGVGIAALQVARWVGATVYATVGSEEKVDFVSGTWDVPRERIFSSRDSRFVEGVKAATGGRGVDVVLNSLAGELLHASWDCVAPHGTFIELGKRDTLAGGQLAMAAFDGNRSFVGVEMANLAAHDPGIVARLLRQCVQLYEQGHIAPVRPCRMFSCREAEDAFRHIYKGTHVGKVVIDMQKTAVEALDVVVAQQLPAPSFCGKSTYLLVGGMGGLGASIARWMACHGARSFIFLSRSAGNSAVDRDLLTELRGRGCEVEAVPCDVTNETELRAAATSRLPLWQRIRGVLNLAMVLSDAALPSLTLSQWEAATAPKIRGTWNLHRVLPSDVDLDFFVLFGSTSGIHGYPGQANYAAANTFLDAFAQYRRRRGLPCSVLDLGGVEDVGYVSRTSEVQDAMNKAGSKLLSESDMLRGLQLAMAQSRSSDASRRSTTAGPGFDGQVLIGLECSVPLDDVNNRVVWKQDPRMVLYPEDSETLVREGKQSGASGLLEFLARLQSKPEEVDTPSAIAYLAQEIALRVCGFLMKEVDETGVDTSVSPSALGVDSLMTIEIRNWWKHTLGGEISVLQLTSAQSFDQLGHLAAKQLKEKMTLVGS